MKMLTAQTRLVSLLGLFVFLWTAGYAQITPLGDSYVNTSTPTTNYGAAALLDVNGAKQTTYIQFNLASIPATASVSQATLKLYVNAVTTAGSFNVDYVNGAWSEGTIDSSNAPALGAAIASNVSVTTADKNQYILVNVTSAVQAWLSGSETNNGLALVANSTFDATFDSKESTTTSHPPELDIAFAGGDGTITGVETSSSSGLTGGGTSGTLNLSLLTSCASNQVLQWSGSAWKCSSAGTGTITGVTAGSDLTGGGTSGNVTLNLNTANVPLLGANNVFTGNNTFGTVAIGGTRSLEVNVPGTSVAEIVNATSGTDAALSLYNTGSGGHEYWIDSGSAGSGAGAGNFAVWDNTDFTARLVVGPTGNVGIGTTVPGAGLSMSGGLTINGQGETLFSTQFQGVNSFAMNAASASNGNGWTLYDYASGSWTPGLIQEGGLVGIGTAPGKTALNIYDDNSDNTPFAAGGRGTCIIDYNGDLICTGSKNAAVPVDGDSRWVAMSAIESPVNWFEDAGTARLANGVAVVELDPTFFQTVNTIMDYKVFPVPNGDCKGLYVTNKTPSSFEVRELGGGTSSVAFDYRIMAVRKNYEAVRFADHTREKDLFKFPRERMKTRAMKPQPPTPTGGTQAATHVSLPAQALNNKVRATAPAIHQHQ